MYVRWWFIAVLGLVACEKKVEKIELPVEVVTYVVKPQSLPLVFNFVGVVQSSHSVEIRSRVEGYLEKIAYKEGSFVKEGDLLFQIDRKQFEAVVKEAEANLEKEKAILWQAQKAVDRYKPLYEQKAASRKDLDDATAQLLAEEAAVSMYRAKLDEANLNLGYASIRSPISGITTNSLYQEGALIFPNSNGMMTKVSVLDPIWVVLNVSEYYFTASLEEVAKGRLVLPKDNDFEVTVRLNDGTDYPYKGKVSFVSPIYDQSTGTLSTRAVFENPNAILKPGQFVNAKVSGATKLNAILVPQAAVQQGIAGKYVYIVNRKNRIEMRLVQVGDWYGEDWEIRSGIEKNDQVVVLGTNKVKEGTLVKVVQNK